MITKSKQVWESGKTVKVGFTSLVVVQSIPTPGDYAPDAYILVNHAGTKLYKFVPHNGLQALSLEEANEMIAESSAYAARQAAAVIAQAQAAGNIASRLLGAQA